MTTTRNLAQPRIDGHIHGCRVLTAGDEYVSHLTSLRDLITAPLSIKQRAVGVLHELEPGVLGPAYTPECLDERMRAMLEAKIAAGEGEVHVITDTTADAVGLIALDTILRLKKEYADRIKVFGYCYPIFGLNPDYPERLKVLEQAAERADGIMGLAERDAGNSLGSHGHTKKILELAHKNHIPAQFHVGQSNSSNPRDVEEFIQGVKWCGSPDVKRLKSGEPTVWAVHALSLACYTETDFWAVVDDLLKYNIGVVVCGHATASNFEPRNELTPTHPPVTRVLELVYAGVPVRPGVDNANDIFMQMPDQQPYCLLIQREIDILGSLCRYPEPSFWEKIARGVKLNAIDRKSLLEAILQNYERWKFSPKVLEKYA